MAVNYTSPTSTDREVQNQGCPVIAKSDTHTVITILYQRIRTVLCTRKKSFQEQHKTRTECGQVTELALGSWPLWGAHSPGSK